MKNSLRILFLFCTLLVPVELVAQAKVFVLEIKDVIDARMSRYVELGLKAALDAQADYVLIDMDTYGGAVNDADAIRTQILDFEKPVFVFINKNAASAGALISIACDSIYMTKGANIGAATVVNGADGTKAPDKYQSYMRSIMRSTAEARGRNPKIAEAMVDEELEVEGVSKAGEVITFTATEAMQHGYCEGIAGSLEEVFQINGIGAVTIIPFELSSVERIISIFLNPVVSGILILIILGGIYFELQTPGVGFPLAAAILASILYFTPYYLNGLAENWEILLFLAGLTLIALEVFVLPGFGVAGISGILLTVASLILVMVENRMLDFTLVPNHRLISAILVTAAGVVGAVVFMVLGAARLSNSRMMRNIALQDTLNKDQGFISTTYSEDLVGKVGTAFSVLRPGGKVLLEGEIYDASTRGNFIDKGEPIIVTALEGSSLKVRKYPN